MDQLPLDGRHHRPAGVRAARRGGRRPASSSTRPTPRCPASSRTERDIAPGARPRSSPGGQARIIVASLRRHVHRVQQVLDAAARARPQGRLRRPLDGAQHGRRPRPRLPQRARPGLLVDVKQLDDLPDDQIVLICTGSQGEPMAALSRIANRDHQIRIGEGDTVILASSLIPGNENAVYRVINGLTRWGANVVHKGNAMVHVSGHAVRRRAALLLQHRPAEQRDAGARRVAAPAGQRRARGRDRRARATASCSPRTASSSTWSTVAPASSAPCRAATSTSTARASATSPSRRSRTAGSCGDEGFISVFVVVDSATGKVVGGPEIHARGFAEDDTVFDDVRARSSRRRSTRTRRARASHDTHQLQQVVRRTVGQWVSDTLPPPPDDHPGRRRGLSPVAGRPRGPRRCPATTARNVAAGREGGRATRVV